MDKSSEELYKRLRPSRFEEVRGQRTAVEMLQRLLKEGKLPRCLLFSGGSGVGKTTLAYILKKELGCTDADFQDMNAAATRGIDTVREIQQKMKLAPIGGPCRIYLIDEIHKTTNEAQNALLKTLEDTPKHVYFFLCTTDPQKLLKTIITRATEIKLQALQPKEMTALVADACKKEKLSISEDVQDRIVNCADGSARKALVLLHQVSMLEGEDAQLEALERSTGSVQTLSSLFGALMGKDWSEVCKCLKAIDDEPEQVRRYILAAATNKLLAGGKASEKWYKIICFFEANFYDSGKAGLVRACYEVMHQR